MKHASSSDYVVLPGVGIANIYPIGVLKSLQIIRRALIVRGIPNRKRLPIVRHEIRKEVHYIRHQAAARNWRAIRNEFNGYLAEPYAFSGGMKRCGHGWTHKRAIADILRHYKETRA